MQPTTISPPQQAAPPYDLIEHIEQSAAKRRARKTAELAAREEADRAAIKAEADRLAEAAGGPIGPTALSFSCTEGWKRFDTHPLGEVEDGPSLGAALREAGYAPPEVDDKLNGVVICPAVSFTRWTDEFRYVCEIGFCGEGRTHIFVRDFLSMMTHAKTIEPLAKLIHQGHGADQATAAIAGGRQ